MIKVIGAGIWTAGVWGAFYIVAPDVSVASLQWLWGSLVLALSAIINDFCQRSGNWPNDG